MAPVTRPLFDEDPDALYRGVPPRVPRVRAISSSDRLLKPTKASIAASRQKVLTGKDKELAAAREVARKRRRLARVAKENGRLTIPKSPKFHRLKKVTPRARADMLTRTSRELLEIAAIRKRVQAQKRKTQKYHDATTHGAAPGKSDQFSRALSASGGVGVPAVRRPKLTTPVGFEFEIDKRAAAAEARKSVKRKSVAVTAKEVEAWTEENGTADEQSEPPLKHRRKSAAA
ncbi:putative Phosphatidylinositol Kinase [Phytophthora cinnamomi]|uniref:putative Phosphatidylinositol Kinase n=1 Tax=Phytophthora cinnamomi TaxID=4785 RepID=UPI00355A4F25|nr:putative Phosphatidylinositol Kinase [Phytophthora cinnamomi]